MHYIAAWPAKRSPYRLYVFAFMLVSSSISLLQMVATPCNIFISNVEHLHHGLDQHLHHLLSLVQLQVLPSITTLHRPKLGMQQLELRRKKITRIEWIELEKRNKVVSFF